MFSKDTLHLWIIAALLLGGVFVFVAARAIVVPDSYDEFGPFRGDAIREASALKRVLPTFEECLECHTKKRDLFAKSAHQKVSCVHCHGVVAAHMQNCSSARQKVAGQPSAETKCEPAPETPENLAQICLDCHKHLIGRPQDFPQIILKEHLEDNEPDQPSAPRVCLECHLPHDPAEMPADADEDEDEDAAGNAEGRDGGAGDGEKNER
jgi:hypothetical protein